MCFWAPDYSDLEDTKDGCKKALEVLEGKIDVLVSFQLTVFKLFQNNVNGPAFRIWQIGSQTGQLE
jgi:hypothetical protein